MQGEPDLMRLGKKLASEDIVSWLRALRAHASAPYSGYKVSGVVEVRYGSDYLYFAGVNVENAEALLGTHGEEGAVAVMVTALGKAARAGSVWVMGAADLPPEKQKEARAGSCCGRCRQRLAGFADAGTPVHSVTPGGAFTTRTIAELLPDSFSFANLPGGGAGADKGQVEAGLSAEQIKARLVREAPQTESEIFEWLNSLYPEDGASGIAQAAIIRLENGIYAAGVRIEDAAYTGINAVQTALATATTGYGRQKISAVWFLTKAQDKKILPHNAAQPLPLSAAQLWGGRNIPVTSFAADGSVVLA